MRECTWGSHSVMSQPEITIKYRVDTVLGVGGGGGEGGWYTADYRGTAASNNDFSSFKYKCLTGLVLSPGAEFQTVGNVMICNFFTNSTRWAGTYKSSAFFQDCALCWFSTFH
jgi:hypothetical protein